ncbi:hypothetical protein [Nocardia salmonicida]|uniref:hypothetical protein n=1 Tax=Nocardia salmonicida TaxID=53431 RepID=UPI00378C1185
MGARSITRIVTADGTHAFFRRWGSPEYQMPRIAQFLLLLDLGGEPVTVQAWRDFAEATTSEGSPLVAAEEVDADDLPSDLDHLYVINVEDGFSFAHFTADRSPLALGRWAVQGEADNLAEVLALALRYAERLVRRAHQLLWVDAETIAGAERWANIVRQMVEIHEATDGDFIAPRASELPVRREGQDAADHAHAVAEFCAERAEYMATVVEDSKRMNLPTLTKNATREARGWTRTGRRHWLATL